MVDRVADRDRGPDLLTDRVPLALFVAGYATAPDDVPDDVRLAILETFAHLYEHRGDATMELPETAMALLASHKDWLV